LQPKAGPNHSAEQERIAYLENGKIERWHKSLKGECMRPGTPLSLEDARRLVDGYVEHYNSVRLSSAVGYITPKDMLAGRQQEIHTDRDESWRRRENSDSFVGGKLREERRGPFSGRFRGTDEVVRAPIGCRLSLGR